MHIAISLTIYQSVGVVGAREAEHGVSGAWRQTFHILTKQRTGKEYLSVPMPILAIQEVITRHMREENGGFISVVLVNHN